MAIKKTFADAIENADREALIKATAAREALEELKDSIERWNDEYHEAAARVSAMRGRFARGVETASAQEFAEALAAEERAKLLANKHVDNRDPDGEDPRIQRAERALPPSDKKVAKAVASALLEANTFPAAQVFSTFANVRSLVPTEADAPVLIVSQSESSWDGTYTDRQYKRRSPVPGVTYSATVTLTLWRRPEHRDIVPERVVRALRKVGGEVLNPDSLNVLMQSVGDGLEKDEIRFTVKRIDDPNVDPELKARRDDWYASRRPTLSTGPQSGMDIFMGLGR
ncbi:hypothetical protein OG249_27015 [Streptomyces microflavus]|uniref:hypothetical protein n=1 Tax=Streptomyces microflavus TaxID=1919 RepID=UPI0022591FBE|nr:hypothetical protein [Streptomyces microflavus]MCX4655534.1 hypothetical protein [Streptomyces microflavus]